VAVKRARLNMGGGMLRIPQLLLCIIPIICRGLYAPKCIAILERYGNEMNQSRRKFFQLCFTGLAGIAIAQAIPETKKPEKAKLIIHVQNNDNHIVEVVKKNYRDNGELRQLIKSDANHL
jgi:hypothetical protein